MAIKTIKAATSLPICYLREYFQWSSATNGQVIHQFADLFTLHNGLTQHRAFSYSPVVFSASETITEENFMGKSNSLWWAALIAGVAALLPLWPIELNSQQAVSVQIDNDDIGGAGTSAKGPEAGVWVIAETIDLPTKFAKIVVADDRGRYLIPDLPKANYNVWVRGYGLADSPKVQAAPGKLLNLTAVPAASAAAAAQYYPPIYWVSMLHVPAQTEFPVGRVETQGAWLNTLKTGGCVGCHSLGSPGTRRVPKMFSDEFHHTAEALTPPIPSGSPQG